MTICVSNVGYKTKGGHLTSPDTQTNWNGITGRIELIGYKNAHAENVMLWCDIHSKTVRVTADITGEKSGKAVISAESFNSKKATLLRCRALNTKTADLTLYTKWETIACFGVSMSLISTS